MNDELEAASTINDDEDNEADVNLQDVESSNSNATFLSKVPYSLEDLIMHQYTPYDEEKDADLSVLPTIDPITKDLIFTPLRNKYCNHVFDENSIYDFISANPEAT